MNRLDDSSSSLYSELLDLLRRAEAERVAQAVPTRGSFVSKAIRGRTYWYLQRYEGSERRQHYLGPETESLRAWIDRAQEQKADFSADAGVRARLAKMLVAAGAFKEQAAVVKILELLSEHDVFRLGGVLVGTHAMGVYCNHLGYRFEQSNLRTHDVDIAQDPIMRVAIGRERGDAQQALADTGMEFLPTPRLDLRQPSTSFHVRGRQLRVDFLTPMRGRESTEPVQLTALGVAAQPLRFLEYLLEDAISAAVVGASGVLVRVPDPARFALHKLWTAEKRSASDSAKKRKDRQQAAQLLAVLFEDQPTDVESAWHALSARPKVRQHILESLRHLEPTGSGSHWGDKLAAM